MNVISSLAEYGQNTILYSSGLQVRGSVLGGRQDATLLLTDFPVALLQPVLRAMPGLQHAQPAVGLTGVAALVPAACLATC